MSDKAAKVSQAEQQKILQTFHQMRNEQRSLLNKITELESELVEHRAVLTKLNEVDADRKCYRVIGGVLVERNVKEVAVSVADNRDKLDKLLENLNASLQKKGLELNEYKNKHDLHIRGEGEKAEPQGEGVKSNEAKSILA